MRIPILSRLLEKRWHPATEGEIIRFLKGGWGEKYGVDVNEKSAMRFAAVFSCVRVLSESVAQLPLKLYQEVGGKRQGAEKHPLHSILHTKPNPFMTAFSFWETATSDLTLWGNSYALIDRDVGGQVTALWPLAPPKVRPRKRDNGDIVYEVQNDKGQMKVYLWDEIFHIPGLCFDGIKGKSVIRVACDAIGQGMAASDYAGKFFENGASPSGVIEMAGHFKDETRLKAFRRRWEDTYRGSGNAHRVGILEDGMKWNPMSINPEDAQLLETRKFNRSEIAGIFRVPPHMIADLEHATFTNIESSARQFVTFSLAPWMKRIEQGVSIQLLTPREQKRYFAEFTADAMLRGDTKTRYEAYRTAILGGWMSINEVRGKENMNPIDGGDEHYMQKQMVPLSQIGKQNEGNGGDAGGTEGNGKDGNNAGQGNTGN